MSLTGELEHLPIVDVIQLINSTRKSGTLYVYSRKGKGQLVFNQGYIVGASHSNEKLRIGQILLEADLISAADLAQALAIQESAGDDRKPLIAILFEHCGMSSEAAFKALETLIEMTVVEMITWVRGTFSLDINKINVIDDYRYLPDQLKQQVTFDSQMILLDALRIYDEKINTGEISLSDEPLDTPLHLPAEAIESSSAGDNPEEVLSEEILGLADLDTLKRKKPRCFQSLDAFDPTEIHRQIVARALPRLTPEAQERLTQFLAKLSSPDLADEVTLKAATQARAVVMYANDEFMQHAVMTVCKAEGIMVFTTSEQQDLSILLERAINKHLQPLLLFDIPDPASKVFNATSLGNTRQLMRSRYPHASIIQFVRGDDVRFSLQALSDGVKTVFPRPFDCQEQPVATEARIEFLSALRAYLQSCFNPERQQQFVQLRAALAEMSERQTAPEISLAILRFVALFFDRVLTLVISKEEFIAERSIGLRQDKLSGASPPLYFRISRGADSLLEKVCREKSAYLGVIEDRQLLDLLFSEIGAPHENQVLLLPLLGKDRVITITYADFGARPASTIPLDYLDFFAQQASLKIENALYRKQLSRTANS